MPEYHTFVCTSPFSEFEENHSEIVAVDASSHLTGNVLDFFNQERREMWAMTEASEFSKNVFMGPTPEQGSPEEQNSLLKALMMTTSSDSSISHHPEVFFHRPGHIPKQTVSLKHVNGSTISPMARIPTLNQHWAQMIWTPRETRLCPQTSNLSLT
ncbi:hypothetical protein LB503_013588 [Fusarium chuoi]|nr:hypothetical protein LB503_013588 [Fusarium chuoi]